MPLNLIDYTISIKTIKYNDIKKNITSFQVIYETHVILSVFYYKF